VHLKADMIPYLSLASFSVNPGKFGYYKNIVTCYNSTYFTNVTHD